MRKLIVQCSAILIAVAIISGTLLAQESPEPTAIPTETPTDTLTFTPTDLPTVAPTETPLPTETATPTPTETVIVTEATTETPTVEVTAMPSQTPTESPVTTEPPPLPTLTEASLPAEPPLSLLFSDTFDSGALDLWTLTAGWSLVSSDGGQALQVSGSNEPVTFIYNNLFNIAVSARVKMTSGTVRVSIRQSAAGSYTAALDANGQVTLYRGGVVFQSANNNPIIAEQWRVLRLSAVDDIVRVTIDGAEVIAIRDSAMLPPGTVAFAGDGGNTVTLDDVQLWVPADEMPSLPTPTLPSRVIQTPEQQSGFIALDEPTSCTISVAASDTAGLIAAINTANSTTEVDTICLENSTYTLTNFNNSTINGKNGFPLIPSEITIEGNGAIITRSGSAVLRYFEVSFFGNLTLRNLTLTNANASEGTSYAIYTAGHVTIENSTLTDNIGGSIWVTNTGTLNVTDTTITNSGRALENRGTATIVNSTISNQTSGGINNQGSLTIQGSTFTNNRAHDGGAIENRSNLTISNTIFDGNTAQVEGGAINHISGPLSITGSIFINNSATDPQNSRGGAIHADASGSKFLSNSCIVGNYVASSNGRIVQNGRTTFVAENNWWGVADGPSFINFGPVDSISGGIDYQPFLTLPPANCPTQPLTAVDQGIAVTPDTPIAITLRAWGGLPPYTFSNISTPANGSLTGTPPDLTYTPNTGFQGVDTFTFDTVDSNTNTVTALITLNVGVDALANIVVNSTAQEVPFVNNGNCTLGEAIQAANTNVIVDGCAAGSLFAPDYIEMPAGTYTLSLVHNTGSNGANGLPVVTGATTIYGNGATITRSGSTTFRLLEVSDTGSLTLQNITLSNGSSSLAGGAIRSSGPLTIENGTFSNNQSQTGGGALSVGNALTITDSTFTGNTAVNGGGAIAASAPTPITISNTSFVNNRVTTTSGNGYGGAISSSSTVNITNSTFSGNTSLSGGAIAFDGTFPASITNTTFNANSVTRYGGALFIKAATVTLTDTIFTYNISNFTSTGAGAAIETRRHDTTNTGGIVYMSNSCIVGNTILSINSGNTFDARNNWWGRYDGPRVGSTAPVNGEWIGGTGLQYTPFLTTPPMPGCPVFPPIATSQNVNVLYNTPTAVTLGAAGGIPDYTFALNTNPTHGTLSGTVPNLTYTPNAGFTGTDSFTFGVTDSVAGVSTGTINITIISNVDAVSQTLFTAFQTPVSFTLGATGSSVPFTFVTTTTPTNGVLSGTPPNLTFTPNNNYFGTQSIGFRVTDTAGFTDTGTISIQVARSLTVVNQDLYVQPGVPLNIPLQVSGGRTPYTYNINPPANGVLNGLPPSTLNYTMNVGYTELDNFTVDVTDANGTSAVITIRLSSVQPLTATDSSVYTPYQTPILLNLNATGGQTPYTFAIISPPANGTLSGTPPAVIFMPNSGFAGNTSLMFRVTDAFGFSDNGAIQIAVGQQLIVSNHERATSYETPINITVTVTGGVSPYTYSVSNPAHGVVTGTAPNLVYTPNSGFSGSDSFTVMVNDNGGSSATGTINLTVSAPVTVSTVSELIAAIQAANANSVPDTIFITPSTYTLTDVHNTTGNGPNGLPVITSQIAIIGNATITRAAGSPLFRLFEVSTNGNLTLEGVTISNGDVGSSRRGGGIYNVGTLTLTNSIVQDNRAETGAGIANRPNGRMTLEHTWVIGNIATDNGGGIHNTSSVNAGVINDSVIAGNRAVDGGGIFSSLTPMTITNTIIANNTSTSEGGGFYGSGPITVRNSCISGNSHPSVYSTDGVVDFQSNWWGSMSGASVYDSLNPNNGLKVGDSANTSVMTGNRLTAPVLGCPQALDQTLFTPFQQPISFTLSAAGGTPPYTFNSTSTPANGVLSGTAPNLTYTPNGGFNGTNNFTFTVTDSNGWKTVGLVTVNVAPQLVAIDLSLSTLPGTPATVTLAATGGRSPYIFAIASSPSNGSVSGTSPNLTYTPNSGFEGTDAFTFTVTDSNGASSTGTVTINVSELAATDQTLSTDYASPLVVTLGATGGVSPYTFQVMPAPENGAVAGAPPSVTYIPNTGFSGTDSFIFQVTDNLGNVAEGTITVNVGLPPGATIVVTTTAQELPFVINSNCTLGEAIQAAKTDVVVDACAAGGSADIIEVPAGVYTLYNLSASEYAFTITGTITIRGAGIDETIIERPITENKYAFFNVATSANLTLQDMTLHNGGADNSSVYRRGGAVNNSGTLTVMGVKFDHNHVYNDGGALYNNTGATMNVWNSVFIGNTAEFRGGAIYNNTNGTINIWNSVFYQNQGLMLPIIQGNTLYSAGPTFARNNCFLDAGDSSHREFTVDLNGLLPQQDARHNWWENSPTVTGANYQPMLSMRPAICFQANVPSLNIAAGDVNGLIAAIEYANTLSSATIELAAGSTYTLTTPYRPGIVNGQGLPDITSELIINGNGATITRDSTQNFRIFTAFSTNLTINNLTISNGHAQRGAGISIGNESALVINNVTFLNNHTDEDLFAYGGAIYSNGSGNTITITNSVFDGNFSPHGGGISLFMTGTLTVTDSIFTNNNGISGSSIGITRGSAITISNNCFVNNAATSVYNDTTNNSSTIISVINNWWGATDGPSGVGTGSGDTVGAQLTFVPFTTVRPLNCVANPLVAADQSLSMSYYAGSHPIALSAAGGVPPYSFSDIGAPANGTVSGSAPNLIYTPNLGFTGTDSFIFTVSDVDGLSDIGTITIVVDAPNILVDSTDQEMPFVNNGNCTLGEAIQAANSDTSIDACPAGNADDIIELTAGTYVLALVNNNTNGPNGLPSITTPIDINGNGATITRSTAGDTPDLRIFHVASSGTLDLANLNLSNGRVYAGTSATDLGAGVYNLGTLTISNSTLTGHYAGNGSAVYSVGPMTLQNVTITGNTAVSVGGGVYNCALSTINDSVIEDNTAYSGGGIFNQCNSLTITNTTIADNTATNNGGGIANIGSNVTISNSIFRDNHGPIGSSINADYTGSGSKLVTVSNSCIMDHSASAVHRAAQGTSVTLTNNWWGSTTGPGGSANGYGSTVRGWNMATETYRYTPFLTAPILNCGIFPPTGINQMLYTAPVTAVNITLAAVDGTPPYSFGGLSSTSNGSVSGIAPNLIYTPNPGFSGTDTLIFDVTDASSNTGTGTITIQVAAPLVANDLTLTTNYQSARTVNLGANGGRAPFTFTVSANPSDGVISGTPPNVSYTPNSGFTGIDTFTYSVSDANGSTDSGSVAITVGGPLIAGNQSVTTFEGTALPIILSAAGGTPPYRYGSFSTPGNGVVIGINGRLTYVPLDGFVGTDSFSFTATDAANATATGTITIIVSNTEVNVPSGNVVALIAAINAANAASNPTTLSLAPASTYLLTSSDTIPPITGELLINGNGATLQRTDGSGAIFTVESGGRLTLDTVTIGDSSGDAVLNDGGILSLTGSTLAANAGTGIDNDGGSVIVVNSTINGNGGAGIDNQGGSVSVTSSTITDNQNGLRNTGGEVTITNTILATNNGDNCTGAIISNGYNLEDGSTCGLSASGDLDNTSPQLGPLQDNGGPTFTQALMAGSPALDTADNTACYWRDQRGAQRPVDNDEDGTAVCDIGAYEGAPPVALQPPASSPSLSAPASGVTTNANPLALSWLAVDGGPFSYHIQVDNQSNFSSPERSVQVTSPVYNVTGLPDGLYYWRVRAINGLNVASAWSVVWRFRLDTIAPAVPVLSTPGRATSDTTPAFAWRAAATATRYELQVATDVNFISVQIDVETSRPVYTPASALSRLRHYWRVRAQDAAGNWSAWSAANFTDITNMRAPANGTATVDTTPTLLWYAVTNAVGYQLVIASDSDFSNAVTYNPIATQYTLPALDYGTYFWRVDVNHGTGFEPSAVVWQLTITPPLPVGPVLTAPASGFLTNISEVDFSWNVVSGTGNPFTYQVQLDNNAGFTSPERDVTTNNLTYSTMLPSNGRYYWRVRAINNTGAGGRWSAARVFTIDTTPPVAPTLRQPANANTVASTRPTLMWIALRDANRYRIDLADNPAFTNPLLQDYEGSRTSLTLSSTVLTTPLVQGHYYWRIQARDAAGNWGSESATWAFTVFLGTAPANGVFTPDTTPTFRWIAVSGATTYQLQVAHDPDFNNPLAGYPLTLGAVTTYTPTVPLANGAYFWRVLYGGEIPLDIVARPLFIAAAPAAPTLLSPVHGALLNGAAPELSWNTVTPPAGVVLAGYEVQIANNTAFTMNRQSFVASNMAFTPPALSEGLHYWRVRALFDAQSPGAWSRIYRFSVDITTPLAPPTSLPIPNAVTADTTPSFTWIASIGANFYEIQVDDDPLFNSPITRQTGGRTFTVVTPLAPGRYYWRLRARDAAGNWSTYGVTHAFQVSSS